MKRLQKTSIVLLVIVLVYFGFNLSKGPKIIIETPKPAEDFLVLCTKSKDYLIGHNASSYSVVDKVFVVKSNELVDCGVMFWGDASGVRVSHPVYTGDGGKSNYEKDGVKHIVLNKTQLDYLDEQKAKFEAGYWDKYMSPGSRYAESIGGCGFPHKYFDYYSQVKKVEKEHFRKLYHDVFLECKKRVLPIKNKYLPHTVRVKRPTAEKSMENLWNSKGWEKHQ